MEIKNIIEIIETLPEDQREKSMIEVLFHRLDRSQWDAQSVDFYKRFTKFQKNMPKAKRSGKGQDETGKEYDYTTLDDVIEAVALPLAQQGLTYSFFTSQVQTVLEVSCALRSERGHEVCTTLSHDMGSVESMHHMDRLQLIGTIQTFLKRYTLSALTGLSAEDSNIEDIVNTRSATITLKTVSALQLSDIEKILSDIAVHDPNYVQRFWEDLKQQNGSAVVLAQDYSSTLKALIDYKNTVPKETLREVDWQTSYLEDIAIATTREAVNEIKNTAIVEATNKGDEDEFIKSVALAAQDRIKEIELPEEI